MGRGCQETHTGILTRCQTCKATWRLERKRVSFAWFLPTQRDRWPLSPILASGDHAFFKVFKVYLAVWDEWLAFATVGEFERGMGKNADYLHFDLVSLEGIEIPPVNFLR